MRSTLEKLPFDNRTVNNAVVHIATLGPVGYLPIAPGTWGSGAAVILWWLLLANQHLAVQLTVIVVTIVLAIWSAGIAEQALGHDAKPIVIDEVVGQWITLTVCSTNIIHFALAFFLFRLFDVWKPFPVKQMEKFPGGLGVVLDDLLAGGYAALVLLILRTYL